MVMEYTYVITVRSSFVVMIEQSYYDYINLHIHTVALFFFFFYQLSFLHSAAVTTAVSLDNVFNFFIQPVNEILYVLRFILS